MVEVDRVSLNRATEHNHVQMTRNVLTDLPAAILTPKQRQYLAGKTDIEPNSDRERGIRRRIRNRVRSSLFDFHLLLYALEPRDREAIVKEANEWSSDLVAPSPDLAVGGGRYLFDQSFEGVGFLFSLLLESESWREDIYSSDEELLATAVEAGIREALPQHGDIVESVTVDISVERAGSVDDINKENLADLSARTLTQMLSIGEISEREFSDAIVEKRGFPVEDRDDSSGDR